MKYRAAGMALLSVLGASCAKVRDFGCLADGYSISAPSHVEMGISEPGGAYVLERYVFQVGLADGFIVALCQVRPGADAQPDEGEKPCVNYNVIDTRSGQVSRDLSKDEAAGILTKAGIPMPKLGYAADYFNYDWPDGDPGAFCRAHPEPNPAQEAEGL